METDIWERDTLPDLKSLLCDGMREQTAELDKFVQDLNTRFPNKITLMGGQSMGTIPATVVAFKNREKIPTMQLVVIEPRMDRDLAAIFTSQPDEITEHFQKTATSWEVAANPWNRYRVTTLGEAPPINAKNSFIITKDGKPLSGEFYRGMGMVEHTASNSIKNIALGTEGFGLSTVAPETLPTNAAQVLRSKGGSDITWAAITGVSCLALTSCFAVVAALMVAKNIKDRMQNG